MFKCVSYPSLHTTLLLWLTFCVAATNTVTELPASGGSALLNLDLFGPVDDSSSSSSAIPGQQSV